MVLPALKRYTWLSFQICLIFLWRIPTLQRGSWTATWRCLFVEVTKDQRRIEEVTAATRMRRMFFSGKFWRMVFGMLGIVFNMEPRKRRFLEIIIFRFHVKLWGCSAYFLSVAFKSFEDLRRWMILDFGEYPVIQFFQRSFWSLYLWKTP